jgi:cysteine desulfurase/selenocysteine lyase
LRAGAFDARELLDAMPFLGGRRDDPEVRLRIEFNDVPWKFEGHPDISAAIGPGVAADYLRARHGRVRARRALVAYALGDAPREVPDRLYGRRPTCGGVVPFNLPDIHPHDVAQILDRQGICIRAGHHCTMPLHERLDLAATGRASFSVFTTTDDIDALAAGLREVQRVFGG